MTTTAASAAHKASQFKVKTANMLKDEMLWQYLRQKGKARSNSRQPTQMLSDGVPCRLNAKGLPIRSNVDDAEAKAEASGEPYFSIEKRNGEKILYREDSIKKLHNNNSLRYENNIKAFMDDYHDYSVEVHGIVCQKNKGGKKDKGNVDEQKDFALVTNKRTLLAQ